MSNPNNEGGTSEEKITGGIGEITCSLTGQEPEDVNIDGSSLGTPVK